MLLAGQRSSGGIISTKPVRHISRISYLSGRSQLHPPGASGGVLRHDLGGPGHSGGGLPSEKRDAQVRNSTRPARPLFLRRREQGSAVTEHGAPLGAEFRRWKTL